MAIKTVNPRYEGFIFDGENSRDYGIYVQSVKVFGAPTRDVEMVSIPGRDGEFVLDKGRFNNIQVVYTCAFGTYTKYDFNTGVSDFRNWLASRKGYKRLEDEINIGEYRMAVFKDGLDVSTLNKETGTFEVTFDCKPQRWLNDASALPVEMASGDDIYNPTLFESHPTLEVNGYGSISIGGGEITLHNDPIGRVQLGGGGSYKNSLTYHFDESQFNTGDYITVPDYRRTYQFDMVKPYGSGQITDFQYTSMTAADYIFNATKYQGSLTLLTDASIFSVGTARTDEYRIAGKLLFNDRTGTAYQADAVMATSVIYDGAGTIRFTASVSYADGNGNFTLVSVAGNAPNFYGDSTWQPVTDTAYIDLDIGEAYVVQGGSVVGINNIVDLPAELPTLKSGHNAVTFDNTITKLVILPRWWKV